MPVDPVALSSDSVAVRDDGDHSAVVVAETESAALGAVLGVYDKTVAKDWSFERVCRADAEASGGVWQLGEYERG